MAAQNSEDASLFTIREANERIGGGKKAHFYTTIGAVAQPDDEPETTYSAPEFDEVKKPTMFDGLNNDWEKTLSTLCYMSSHIQEYQENLNSMLSDMDKEVCDLLHFLEFNELGDNTPIIVERIVTDIDDIVKIVRFDGWQNTTGGRQEVKKALRSVVWVKYKIKDKEVFDKAYSYIEEYY